ncbi:MAG: glycosyltransferase family 4 protein [Pseudomonadota bacterium]
MTRTINFDELIVIAPNFKKRLSGVTSTIVQLIPLQRATGLGIAAIGAGLPDSLPKLGLFSWWKLYGLPSDRKPRVWHARRNTEMLGGLVARHIFRLPLKLVFTSASQRKHTAYTKWLIRQMDAVIATSQKTADYLEVPNTVVMHGIDTLRFCPPADKPAAKQSVGLPTDMKIVGCFGRVRAQKGTDLFADAMIIALKDRPDWMAVIAGRATEAHQQFQNELKRHISDAGMEDRIIFVGEHTDIERWYQAIDLFVAPQRWEGFGLTPLEAMACAVPVIATDVGAFAELVEEDKTGHILADFESTTMAEKVSRLMDDDALRANMAQASRDHMECHFPIVGEVRQLAQIYADVSGRELETLYQEAQQ